MINFKILTLFPELFPGPLAVSVMGAALKNNLWSLQTTNIRNYAKDKHQTVDDTPYGGGAGMVLKPDILADAIEATINNINALENEKINSQQEKNKNYSNSQSKNQNISNQSPKIIYLSPRGKTLTQRMAQELAKEQEIILLCGRYEGVDQRVLDEFQIEEISIGDYVLSGGELAAYVLIDAILRNVSGILGAEESLHEESFSGNLENMLEYPHYTKPQIWRGHAVPEVLTQGHHKKINQWRKEQAIEITKKNRPDLICNSLNLI